MMRRTVGTGTPGSGPGDGGPVSGSARAASASVGDWMLAAGRRSIERTGLNVMPGPAAAPGAASRRDAAIAAAIGATTRGRHPVIRRSPRTGASR